MYIGFKLFIEYCSHHTISNIYSIPNLFRKRFPPRDCVAVFVIKRYASGISTFTRELYVVKVSQKESLL